MSANYKEILEQAKQEKQKTSLLESQNVDKQVKQPEPEDEAIGLPPSNGTSGDDFVNLCVRVPKSWRKKVKAAAVEHDVSLSELVTQAIDLYLTQQGWER